jgi:hypothetical protein
MLRRSLGGLFVACLLLPAASGCALVFEHNEQLRSQEPRQCARFETDKAADLFQTAYAHRLKHQDPTRSASVGIIFVTWMSWTTTVAEAAFYNDELAVCDTNHDGFISEVEAAAYHRRVFPPEATHEQPLPPEPVPAVLGQPAT